MSLTMAVSGLVGSAFFLDDPDRCVLSVDCFAVQMLSACVSVSFFFSWERRGRKMTYCSDNNVVNETDYH